MKLTSALSSLRGTVRRRRRLARNVFLPIAVLGLLWAWLSPPMYAANTTLLAKYGREYTVRSETTAGSFMPNLAMEDIVNTVVEIMKSDDLAQKVVERIGPYTLYPIEASNPPQGMSPVQAAAAELQRYLKISPTRRSNIISVDFRHTDPQIAAATLNTLVDLFQSKYLGLYGESHVDVVDREVESTHQAYAGAADAVSQYESEHSAFVKDTQIDVMLLRRADLIAQQTRIQDCCSDSPAAASIRQQIAELDARIKTINDAKSTLDQLARRRDLLQEAYDTAMRKAQEARVNRALDESRVSSVQVIDAAVAPPRPARPGRILKSLIVLAFASILAIACAVLAEARRRRFSTADELRRVYALPVLAELPRRPARPLAA